MIMKQKRFYHMSKMFVGLILLALVVMPIQARFFSNSPLSAFEEPSSTSSLMSISSDVTIETYVIQGAGYFFKSYSNGLMVSNMVEMSDLNGVNWTELKDYVNQAVSNMELARETYISLVNKANNTPYKQSMVDLLVNFDYTTFKHANNLNGSVFNDVQDFLEDGDVRGVYSEALTRIDATLSDLYGIKTLVDDEKLPTNTAVWRLNQKYSETQLFGQYAAEVFYSAFGQ